MQPKHIIVAFVIVVVLVLGYVVMTGKSAQSAPAQPIAIAPIGAPVVTPSGSVAWKCAALVPGGPSNIMRRVNGVLECATANGRDCFWYNSLADCNTGFAAANKDGGAPLNCATTHVALYGDGRADPKHWCFSQRSDV